MALNIQNTIQQQKNLKPTDRGNRTIGLVYFLAALGFAGIYWALVKNIINTGEYTSLLRNLCLAACISLLVLVLTEIIKKFIARHSHQKYLRYNLIQIIKLVSVLVIVLVFVSFLFHNWYTAAVSLGLISLILGFALQTPISSFIGWLYIIFRSPYHVGDRIQVGTFKGDVVEIGYLDTTLWEFGGDYLTSDLPSGRLIRFPNILVFQSAVHNYSWEKFPYIWNEIPFHVAYESDLDYIQNILRETATEILGKEIEEHIQEFKELLKHTPVDELEIKDSPIVTFRTNANTWIEVTLVYLVDPKKASFIRSDIIHASLTKLLMQPEKVMFPKSNAR